jgi:antitoxin (DNA-binding transcriptional repressor) of toxin-antitoxin stability system
VDDHGRARDVAASGLASHLASVARGATPGYGETYHVTRNGVEIAELRPVARRRRPTADELVERHRRLPRIDHDRMREEADEFFGTEDHIPSGPAKTQP